MRFALCVLCFWWTLLAGAAPAPAPNDAWALSQWQRKVWQIEDGLPHNYVTALTQDPAGRLMIGTKSGIVTFDGFKFEPYVLLPDAWVTCLLRTSDGALWVGTHDAGLYEVTAGHAMKIADGSFFSLIEARDHRVWAVSDTGAGFVDRRHLQLAGRGTDTEAFGWQPLGQDGDDSVWYAAKEGLVRMRNGTAETARLRGIAGRPVTFYSTPTAHTIYLGTTTGLYRLSCSDNVCAGDEVKDVRGPIVGLREANDGTLWIATWGRGLYRLSFPGGEPRVENLDSRTGLADEFVRTLYEDTEHNMWVGTRGGGLTRFRTTVLKPFGIAEGMDGNCASAAVGDGDGGVWLGTWRSGLFHWSGGMMQPQPLPADRLGILITSLATNAAKDLWIGAFHGSWVLRHGEKTAQRLPGLLETASVRQFFFAQDKSLWIVKTSGQLLLSRDGNLGNGEPVAILPGEHISFVAQDTAGAMWVGSQRGLLRVAADGSSAELVLASRSPVLSVSEDRRNRLWIAFDDGGLVVKGTAGFVRFSSVGLPNKLVYKVMQDVDGNVWFSTGLGLARMSQQDVDRAIGNNNADARPASLGIAEGARTIECRCAQFPQAWASTTGTMWIPTSRGFVRADPRRVGHGPGPHASIDSIQWDGEQPVAVSEARLPAGAHNLEVHFTAVRLGAADEVSFRYRLDGVDDRWIDADRNHTARYSQLPPGRHSFHVSARDAIGEWSEPVEAVIRQQPHLYQTIWFECVLVALIPLIMGAIHWFRMRGIHQRYNAVLEERVRIAREWHDTLLAGLAGIGWQLDGAIHVCEQPTLLANLKSVRSMLSYCSREARMAVEGLRKELMDTPDLSRILRETLQGVTQGSDVVFDLRIDPELPSFSEHVRSTLWRICQEAALNAVRHGNASRLEVSLQRAGTNAVLQVQDDGVGIPPEHLRASPEGHFGMMGMRERAQRAGGKLDISSTPGEGTTVTATVPVVG